MKNPANQIAQLRDHLTALENSDTAQPLNELGPRPGPLDVVKMYGRNLFRKGSQKAIQNPLPAAAAGIASLKTIVKVVIGLGASYNIAQMVNNIRNNKDYDSATKNFLHAVALSAGAVNLPVGVIAEAFILGYDIWVEEPFTAEETTYCDKMADYYYRKLKRPPKPDDEEIVHIKFFKRISNTYDQLEKEYGKVGTGKAAAPTSTPAPTPASTPAPTASTPAATPASTPAPTASGPTEPTTQELKKAAGIPPKKKLSDLL
jgi:hypothetical protein